MAAMRFVSLIGVVLGLGLPAAAAEPPTGIHPDHIILGARDLDEGVREFERRTGVRPVMGGAHPGRGTRNALASLGTDVYVEILAPQKDAPDPGPAAFLKAYAELTPIGWAAFVPDVEGARRRLAGAGIGLSETQDGSRARPDGSLLAWKTFQVTKPEIAGMPFFIHWGDGTTHPSQDSPAGCRLQSLRIATPGARELASAFAAIGLTVPTERASTARMEVTLRCPAGTVTFTGEPAARRP